MPDGLDILIDVFSSHGISLEKHMVENSIFICPDKVKIQMDDLMNLLRNLGKSNSYIKKGNSKLPVRFSEDAVNVKYLDVSGKDLRPVITKKKIGNITCKAQDVYTQIYPGAIPSGVVPVLPMADYYRVHPIIIDYDGNDFVRTAIRRYTGVWVCENNRVNMLRNYKISHIWPDTADPFYFSSLWNVVIIPAHCKRILNHKVLSRPFKISTGRSATCSTIRTAISRPSRIFLSIATRIFRFLVSPLLLRPIAKRLSPTSTTA